VFLRGGRKSCKDREILQEKNFEFAYKDRLKKKKKGAKYNYGGCESTEETISLPRTWVKI